MNKLIESLKTYSIKRKYTIAINVALATNAMINDSRSDESGEEREKDCRSLRVTTSLEMVREKILHGQGRLNNEFCLEKSGAIK